MRVIRPFLKAARESGIPDQMLRLWERADPDMKVALSTASRLLDASLQLTGDADYGLRAALNTSAGDFDVLEYAAGSCNTLRDALDCASQHLDLVRDQARLDYEVIGNRFHLRVAPSSHRPRATIDFYLSVAYLSHRRWLKTSPSEIEVWFSYPRPADLSMFHKVFDSATRLRFEAPYSALVAPSGDLDRRLERADSRLHDVLMRYVDAQQRSAQDGPSLVDRVRRMIADELDGGNPSAEHISAMLSISRRTLVRRLEECGTSFKEVLGHVRSTRSLRHLLIENLSLHETSRKLGYADHAAFLKAFKRWFGMPPRAFIESFRRRYDPGLARPTSTVSAAASHAIS